MSTLSSDLIAENVADVQAAIDAACERANRNPDDVTLVAVSKRKSVAHILSASTAGVTHFGENRVEEIQEKREMVQKSAPGQINWHMIGHIQSRKARHIRNLFDTVESIDSLKIAHKLSGLIVEADQSPLSILVQVNVSGEESKGGFEASDWKDNPSLLSEMAAIVREINDLPGLSLAGLMTMAPFYDDPQLTRPVFASLRQLCDRLQDKTGIALRELSMGMTNDYPVAIEEGATMVRIGRAIFGARTLG